MLNPHRVLSNLYSWFFAISALFLPRDSFADETWTDPYPAIQYLFETQDDPLEIHVIIADLSHPGVSVQVTGEDQKDSVVSIFAKYYGLAVAVNGDFFEPWPHYNVLPTMPLGLSVSDGEPYSNVEEKLYGNLIAFSPDNNPVEIIGESSILGTEIPLWMDQVISGGPVLVANGELVIHGDEERHPRTATCIDQQQETLILVTVDGRRKNSIGMTLDQLAEYMLNLGCYQALNLDGGGSTTMYIEANGGVVNYPSGSDGAGAILYPPGKERRVCNHLGIYFDAQVVDGGTDNDVDSDTESEQNQLDSGLEDDTENTESGLHDAGAPDADSFNTTLASCQCGITSRQSKLPRSLLLHLIVSPY